MKILTQADVPVIKLYEKDSRILIDNQSACFNISSSGISILLGYPIYPGKIYSLRTEIGDVHLELKNCDQCGPGDFNIRFELLEKEHDLVELFTSGKIKK